MNRAETNRRDLPSQRAESPTARQEPRGGFLDHLEAESIIGAETLKLALSLGYPSEIFGHTALGEATWGYLVTSNASIAEVRKIRAELERLKGERERMLCR